MYSDRRGNGQKPRTPDKTVDPDKKDPLTKSPGQKTLRTMRENLYKGLLYWFFVLGLLKVGGGSEMCDVFSGGPAGQCSLYFCKVCVRTKFPVCSILPALIYIRTPCMKYVQKPVLRENLCALQVFLCALISRPVRACTA